MNSEQSKEKKAKEQTGVFSTGSAFEVNPLPNYKSYEYLEIEKAIKKLRKVF